MLNLTNCIKADLTCHYVSKVNLFTSPSVQKTALYPNAL